MLGQVKQGFRLLKYYQVVHVQFREGWGGIITHINLVPPPPVFACTWWLLRAASVACLKACAVQVPLLQQTFPPAAQSANVWEEAVAVQQLLVDQTTLGAPQPAGRNGEMKWMGAAEDGVAQ